MFSIVNLSKKETCIKGYEAFLKCAWSVVNFIQKKNVYEMGTDLEMCTERPKLILKIVHEML